MANIKRTPLIFLSLAGLVSAIIGILVIARFSTFIPLSRELPFSLGPLPPVVMHVGPTAHYKINTPDADAEFANLIPPGGHTITLDENKVYTVTLFHQMKCIDILRRQYLAPQTDELPPLTRHCLLYLRQTILCQANPRIESVKNTIGTGHRVYDTVCHDWTKVYEEAERNHRGL